MRRLISHYYNSSEITFELLMDPADGNHYLHRIGRAGYCSLGVNMEDSMSKFEMLLVILCKSEFTEADRTILDQYGVYHIKLPILKMMTERKEISCCPDHIKVCLPPLSDYLNVKVDRLTILKTASKLRALGLEDNAKF